MELWFQYWRKLYVICFKSQIHFWSSKRGETPAEVKNEINIICLLLSHGDLTYNTHYFLLTVSDAFIKGTKVVGC